MVEKKYTSSSTEIPTQTVPAPPTQCERCGKPVEIRIFTAYDERGQPHTGAFTEFGYKKNNQLYLRDPYTYANWLGLCSHCHALGQDGKLKDKPHAAQMEDHWINLGKPNTRDQCIEALEKAGKLNLLLMLNRCARQRGGDAKKVSDL